MRNIAPAMIMALLLVCSAAGSAQALGIGPGRTEFGFEPGMSRTLEYLVLNNEQKDITVDIYVRGDLSQYISCDQDQIRFYAHESTKTFSCSLNLPQSIGTPGLHDNRIGVVESMQAESMEGATMGGRVGVESQLWISVPYPGYYAEIGLSAPNTAAGDDVTFIISINNKGSNSFTASGTIKVFSPEGAELATLDAGRLTLEPGTKGEIKASWPTTGLGPGRYRAVATVEYNGEVKEAEAYFQIGELRAEIISLSGAEVSVGGIAKLKATVESLWNEPITGMYIDIDVLEDGKGVSSARSETFSLNGWEKKDIVIYLDTEGLQAGTYDIRATLHYLGVTSVREALGGLKVTSFSLDTQTMLVLAIVAMLVVAVIVYAKRRKVRRR